MKLKDHHRRDFVAYLRWHREHRNFYPRDYPLHLRGTASALEAFAAFEDRGLTLPTRQPRTLRAVLRGKVTLNFQIKQWAEGWFDCGGRYAFDREIKEPLSWLPAWVWDAVKEQHWKYT